MLNTISLTYRLSTSAADLLGDDALGAYEDALSAAAQEHALVCRGAMRGVLVVALGGG